MEAGMCELLKSLLSSKIFVAFIMKAGDAGTMTTFKLWLESLPNSSDRVLHAYNVHPQTWTSNLFDKV